MSLYDMCKWENKSLMKSITFVVKYLVMLSSKIISPSIFNISNNPLRGSRKKELHQVVPFYVNNEVFHHFHQLAK